jgi:hypothetical protein
MTKDEFYSPVGGKEQVLDVGLKSHEAGAQRAGQLLRGQEGQQQRGNFLHRTSQPLKTSFMFICHQVAEKSKKRELCCGSGIFIPDPLIFTHPGSRIQKQQQKRGVTQFSVLPFLVATNLT